jgi:hypothetical protein
MENSSQNDVLLEVAQLMRIPAENRRATKELLYVSKRCEEDYYEEKVRENREVFKRIALLCEELWKEFHRLNPSGKGYLQYWIDGARRRSGYRDVLSVLDHLRKMPAVKRKKRSAHRPRGSVKHRLVQILIVELHIIAMKHGGKLTLGMNPSANKPNGTLPAILGLFHEMLPAIVPLNIPYHTLQRMRAVAVEILARPRTPVYKKPSVLEGPAPS